MSISREDAEGVAMVFDLTKTLQSFETLFVSQSPNSNVFNLVATESRLQGFEHRTRFYAELHALQRYLDFHAVPTSLRSDNGSVCFMAFALSELDINELLGAAQLIDVSDSGLVFTTVDRARALEVDNE